MMPLMIAVKTTTIIIITANMVIMMMTTITIITASIVIKMMIGLLNVIMVAVMEAVVMISINGGHGEHQDTENRLLRE